jgi:hypothetical protein
VRSLSLVRGVNLGSFVFAQADASGEQALLDRRDKAPTCGAMIVHDVAVAVTAPNERGTSMKSCRSLLALFVGLAGGLVVHASAGIANATTAPPAEPAPQSTATAPESTETTAVSAAPEPIPSAHSQVVAQGVIDFPDGQFAWTPTEERVDQAGTQVDPQGSQFILADDGPLVVSSGDGRRALLAPGEACLTRDRCQLRSTLSTRLAPATGRSC